MKIEKYTVIRDTREKDGWDFPVSDHCNGTLELAMKTGDYTLQGFEQSFCLERKGRLSEFATNVYEPRFWRELERMDDFKNPFLLLEFTMDDIMRWPLGSGIPANRIKYIKSTKYFLLMKINEIMVKYKTKVIFAGIHGTTVAASIFKRIVENG